MVLQYNIPGQPKEKDQQNASPLHAPKHDCSVSTHGPKCNPADKN